MARSQTAILLKEFNAEEPHKAFDVAPNVAVPEPKDGEVLVRILCRPINPADTLALQGYYPNINKELPTVRAACSKRPLTSRLFVREADLTLVFWLIPGTWHRGCGICRERGTKRGQEV